jgi:uncharacterized membrane protein
MTPMIKQFRIIIAIVLLIASISVVINMLFTPQPIQIVLETGQEIATKSSNYFTITTVMVLIICSSIIGAALTYLFYNSENGSIFKKNPDAGTSYKEDRDKHKHVNYDIIMPLLRDDEKKAVHIIKEHDGEILQNNLVLKLGHSKVRTTRIIASLERKQLITKQRHGMTNSIKLKF